MPIRALAIRGAIAAVISSDSMHIYLPYFWLRALISTNSCSHSAFCRRLVFFPRRRFAFTLKGIKARE